MIKKSGILSLLFAVVCAVNLNAQSWSLVWREDFGVAEDTVVKNFADPTMTVPNHYFIEYEKYKEYGSDGTAVEKFRKRPAGEEQCGQIDDSFYGIANSTAWAYNRFERCGTSGSYFTFGRDHTGNQNGAMLIINSGAGVGEVIYGQDIDFDLCDEKKYKFKIFASSVTNFTAQEAMLTLLVKNRVTGEVIAEIETGEIPLWEYTGASPFAEHEWSEYEAEFTAKNGDKLSLQVINNSVSGVGNDFVIDDISLYRYDEDVDVPDMEIEESAIASESGSSCSYEAQFSVVNSVLEAWQKIDNYVYILWQKSDDGGLTWTNITDQSGINKSKLKMIVDGSETSVFRVIVTASPTSAEAKEQAEYIAANNAPQNGCAYYSISNTISSIKPEPNCTFKESLREIWKETFGACDTFSCGTNSGMVLKPYTSGGTTEMKQDGEYVICSVPDSAIYYMSCDWSGNNCKKQIQFKPNNFNGVISPNEVTYFRNGEVGNAFAFMRMSKNDCKDDPVFYRKTVDVRFCPCKTFMFNAAVMCVGAEWGTNVVVRMTVYDDSGNELASEPVALNYKGGFGKKMASVPFSVPSGYKGKLTLEMALDYGYNENSMSCADWLDFAIDDLSITICGETVPKPKLGIDGDASVQSLTFDCAEEQHEATVIGFADFQKEYPEAGINWMCSYDDGNTWLPIPPNKTESSYSEDRDVIFVAIIGETQEVADKVSYRYCFDQKNDPSVTPDDYCQVYYFTNPVSFKCKETACKEPVLSFYEKEEKTVLDTVVCRDQSAPTPVHIVDIFLTSKVNVDKFYFETKDATTGEWSEPDELEIKEKIEDKYTFYFPIDGGEFKIYAVNDTCKSDSIYLNIDFREELGFAPYATAITQCEDENLTIDLDLLNGEATEWIVMDGDDEIQKVTSATPSTSVTLDFGKKIKDLPSSISIYASDGYCKSEPAEIELDYEEIPSFDFSAAPERVCKGDMVEFTLTKNNDADKSEKHVYAITDEDGNEVDLDELVAYPTKQTKYTVSAVGKYCTTPVTDDVTIDVDQPQAIDLTTIPSPELTTTDPTDGIVCAPAKVEFKVTADNLTQWTWQYREEGMKEFENWEEGSIKETKRREIKKTMYFRVIAPVVSANACKNASSEIIKIVAEKPVEFTLVPDKERVCESDEVELSIVTTDEYDETKVEATANGSPITFADGKYSSVISENTDFAVTINGVKCVSATPQTASVTVDTPLDFTVEPVKDLVCKGDDIEFNLTGETTGIVWYRSTDNTTFEEFTMPAGNKLTATESMYFKASSPENGACEKVVSEVMNVEVEKPLDEYSLVYIYPAVTDIHCNGATLHFGYSFENGTPEYVDAKWYVDDELYTPANGDNSGFSVKHEKKTTYKVTLNGKVCNVDDPYTKSWTIDAEEEPEVSLELVDESFKVICEGTKVSLRPTLVNVQDTSVRYYQEVEGVRTQIPTLEDVTPSETTTYYVSGGGVRCKSKLSEAVIVEVEEKVDFDLTPNLLALVCDGENLALALDLKKGDAKNYLFTKNGEEATWNIKNSKVYTEKLNETTKFELTISGDACDPVSKDVEIEVEKTPKFELSASKNGLCGGEQVELTAKNIENIESMILEASSDGTNFTKVSDFTDSKILEPTETTIYRVSSTGHDVCPEAQEKVKVEVEEPFTVALDPVSELCPNVNTRLEANITGTPAQIVWESSSNGNAFIKVGTGESVMVSPKETTTYRVTLSGKYCESEDAEITVDVTDVPTLTLEASNPHICAGEPLSIQTKFSNDTFDESSIVWTMTETKAPNNTEEETGIQVITPDPKTTTKYTVKALTPNGCEIPLAQVLVTVDEPIVASISDTVVCEGTRVKMAVKYGDTYKYEWRTGEDSSEVLSKSSSYTSQYFEPQSFSITVINGYCTQTLNAVVDVVKAPVIESIEDNGERALVVNATGGSGVYTYNFGKEEQNENILEEVIYGRKYHITVTDQTGCKTDTIFQTELYEIVIDPVFTPNGDGVNDEWTIEHIEKYPNAKITLYDRTGKVILKSTGADFESWDGTYNGHDLPSTDYWYEIHIFELGKTYTGHFTLLRK